jgi:hypothetical protein
MYSDRRARPVGAVVVATEADGVGIDGETRLWCAGHRIASNARAGRMLRLTRRFGISISSPVRCPKPATTGRRANST